MPLHSYTLEHSLTVLRLYAVPKAVPKKREENRNREADSVSGQWKSRLWPTTAYIYDDIIAWDEYDVND